jgi:hypothetical protein
VCLGFSVAPRTTAGSSWRFSASSRRLQTDLERVAPKDFNNLADRDGGVDSGSSIPHLALLESACTPPATGCTAAAQRGEQMRSTVQWRSAPSTALSSAIVRAMTAGGVNAGPEGALTAIPPSFFCTEWRLKIPAFYRTITPPNDGVARKGCHPACPGSAASRAPCSRWPPSPPRHCLR